VSSTNFGFLHARETRDCVRLSAINFSFDSQLDSPARSYLPDQSALRASSLRACSVSAARRLRDKKDHGALVMASSISRLRRGDNRSSDDIMSVHVDIMQTLSLCDVFHTCRVVHVRIFMYYSLSLRLARASEMAANADFSRSRLFLKTAFVAPASSCGSPACVLSLGRQPSRCLFADTFIRVSRF